MCDIKALSAMFSPMHCFNEIAKRYNIQFEKALTDQKRLNFESIDHFKKGLADFLIYYQTSSSHRRTNTRKIRKKS